MKNEILKLFVPFITLFSIVSYAESPDCKQDSSSLKKIVKAMRKPAMDENTITEYSDEHCPQFRFGDKSYFIQAKVGTFKSDSNSPGYELVYWDGNDLKKVDDAKITVEKKTQFDQTSNTIDYAIKFKVESRSSELVPAMTMTGPGHSIEFSTICTAVSTLVQAGAAN